jgi:glycosyltransferase involved in cell wall biosynthesis
MKREQPQTLAGANAGTLQVLQIYYEPAPAGQTKHVFALAQALTREHHVTVAMPDALVPHLQPAKRDLEQRGAKFVPLAMRKLFWPRQTLQMLARLIHRQDWDVVHIHSLEAGVCGRIVGWLASVPRHHSGTRIVYTPQTIDIRRTRWHWLYKHLERLLAATTDAILSVNEADRQRLIGWGIAPHKIATIPNGIDLGASDNLPDPHEVRQALGLDPARPLVLQVARLSAQKDPLAFVKGAALVAQQRPDTQFAMIGQGPLRDEIAAYIQAQSLQDYVHLLGWRDQAHRLMAAADIVTLTSRWEGSPYSLIEAMAASKPIVATLVNGCPEMVADGHSGFLVPQGDVPAWAERVTQLLKNPELAEEMGTRGRQRAEQLFSIQATTSRIIELYQDLARERNHTQRRP